VHQPGCEHVRGVQNTRLGRGRDPSSGAQTSSATCGRPIPHIHHTFHILTSWLHHHWRAGRTANSWPPLHPTNLELLSYVCCDLAAIESSANRAASTLQQEQQCRRATGERHPGWARERPYTAQWCWCQGNAARWSSDDDGHAQPGQEQTPAWSVPSSRSHTDGSSGEGRLGLTASTTEPHCGTLPHGKLY
jgi:hypothetical protein